MSPGTAWDHDAAPRSPYFTAIPGGPRTRALLPAPERARCQVPRAPASHRPSWGQGGAAANGQEEEEEREEKLEEEEELEEGRREGEDGAGNGGEEGAAQSVSRGGRSVLPRPGGPLSRLLPPAVEGDSDQGARDRCRGSGHSCLLPPHPPPPEPKPQPEGQRVAQKDFHELGNAPQGGRGFAFGKPSFGKVKATRTRGGGGGNGARNAAWGTDPGREAWLEAGRGRTLWAKGSPKTCRTWAGLGKARERESWQVCGT